MTEPKSDEFRPPYLAFATFWNFVDELSQHNLPPVIDRSLMSGKSGSDQANLLAALRAFGLIDEDRKVQAAMNRITDKDVKARQRVLEELIREHYASPLEVSAATGTEQQLIQAFRDSYGMDAAETRRKAVTFFLHAAKQAGIELSPYFPPTRSGSGAPGQTKPRSKPRKKATGIGKTIEQDRQVTPPSAEDIVVNLRTGGRMRLSVDVSPITLRGFDREFFFKAVDLLDGYQAAAAKAYGDMSETAAETLEPADPTDPASDT